LDAQRPGGMVTGSDNQPFEAHTPDGVWAGGKQPEGTIGPLRPNPSGAGVPARGRRECRPPGAAEAMASIPRPTPPPASKIQLT
ncbi:hypothetical protein, partial [Bifidobacterium xylocopae]|uniref:hypothetical protein n=1 Tax=Bifidobacterium xylocopae TaxID=2493119 RepID=UPI001F446092